MLGRVRTSEQKKMKGSLCVCFTFETFRPASTSSSIISLTPSNACSLWISKWVVTMCASRGHLYFKIEQKCYKKCRRSISFGGEESPPKNRKWFSAVISSSQILLISLKRSLLSAVDMDNTGGDIVLVTGNKLHISISNDLLLFFIW